MNMKTVNGVVEVLGNTSQNWVVVEGTATHQDGYSTYATVWFDADNVMAIEPHSVSTLASGEVVHHYYDRIMGADLEDFTVELLD